MALLNKSPLDVLFASPPPPPPPLQPTGVTRADITRSGTDISVSECSPKCEVTCPDCGGLRTPQAGPSTSEDSGITRGDQAGSDAQNSSGGTSNGSRPSEKRRDTKSTPEDTERHHHHRHENKSRYRPRLCRQCSACRPSFRYYRPGATRGDFLESHDLNGLDGYTSDAVCNYCWHECADRYCRWCDRRRRSLSRSPQRHVRSPSLERYPALGPLPEDRYPPDGPPGVHPFERVAHRRSLHCPCHGGYWSPFWLSDPQTGCTCGEMDNPRRKVKFAERQNSGDASSKETSGDKDSSDRKDSGEEASTHNGKVNGVAGGKLREKANGTLPRESSSLERSHLPPPPAHLFNGKRKDYPKQLDEIHRSYSWDPESWELFLRNEVIRKRRKRAFYMGVIALGLVICVGIAVTLVLVLLRRKL